MSRLDLSKWYSGCCHCGAVRFQVKLTKFEAIKCNCSICRKKSYLHLIVPPKNFRLLKGEDSLSTYSFNTNTAVHKFCRTCGIHPFYTPRSHPEDIDVNVNVLDEDITDDLNIVDFDGQNWEQDVENIRE